MPTYLNQKTEVVLQAFHIKQLLINTSQQIFHVPFSIAFLEPNRLLIYNISNCLIKNLNKHFYPQKDLA